ncbi:MucR family transcriptional regulator [Sphingomonas sp. 1P06PA]|uniref:MucR family transcriptional regulator n=1 Tax=Sphingomonas sp. 1P06PA TaxID=554121 RepID=UPI0039A6831E
MPDTDELLVTLTADIVSAFVSNNRVGASEVAGVIESTHRALSQLGTPEAEPAPQQKPAVSARASIKPDYLVSLESGKKMKMLKRYLMTNYQMTPEQYRAKWGLPSDYPMVAPNYSEARKTLARKIGLGRKPAAAAPAEKPAGGAKRGPKPKAAAPKPEAAKPEPKAPAKRGRKPATPATEG